MEAITTPKASRKKVPDLTPKPLRNDDSPDPATILFFAGQLEKAEEEIAKMRKVASRIRKRAINAGLVMKELKEIMAEAEMDPDAVAARYARRKLYAEALDVPIGKQFSIFERRPGNIKTRDELCEDAYQKGFAYGVMGKTFDDQAYPATSEFHQHALSGWQAGQAKLGELIKTLEPEPAAAETAKDDEADQKGDDDAEQ